LAKEFVAKGVSLSSEQKDKGMATKVAEVTRIYENDKE
jgi:hypothetical protein